MGHKIKAIRERQDAIAADRKFHPEECHRETQVSNRVRETYHFVRAEEKLIILYVLKMLLEERLIRKSL